MSFQPIPIKDALLGVMKLSDHLSCADLLHLQTVLLAFDALTTHARDVTAERDRLKKQISESHLHARVVELVNECTRHETEARAARAELKAEKKIHADLRKLLVVRMYAGER